MTRSLANAGAGNTVSSRLNAISDVVARHFTDNTKNKRDFSLVLKVCREFDAVISAGKFSASEMTYIVLSGALNSTHYLTSAGKLFHVRAAATGNARSPTVDSCV